MDNKTSPPETYTSMKRVGKIILVVIMASSVAFISVFYMLRQENIETVSTVSKQNIVSKEKIIPITNGKWTILKTQHRRFEIETEKINGKSPIVRLAVNRKIQNPIYIKPGKVLLDFKYDIRELDFSLAYGQSNVKNAQIKCTEK